MTALGLVRSKRARKSRRAASRSSSSPRPATSRRRSSSPTTGIRGYTGGRNFGHLAYAVDDIYATCKRLKDHGVTINRLPRDGHMAFVRSPDNISVELLQKGGALPPAEPWKSMPNVGQW